MGTAAVARWWDRLLALGRSPEALMATAQRLASRGRLQEAIRLARSATRREPRNAKLQSDLGDLLYRSGQKLLAAEAYAAAITVDPSYAPAYRAYIAVRQEEHELEQARKFLSSVVAQAGDDPTPLNYVGVVDYLLGRTEEAVAVWQSIVQNHPRYGVAHSNLGVAYQHQGKFDQALLEYKLAIELDPRGAIGAYNNIAEIYMNRGELEEAIQYFILAVELDPDSAAVPLANLGACYAGLGRREEAIRAYEESLKKTPGMTNQDIRMEVLTALAKLYLEIHRVAEARAACEAALQRSPRSVDALATLGQIQFQEGQYEAAVETFRKALAVNPMTLRNLMVHRLMALAYYKMGHFDKAAAEYRRANAWHPDRIFGTKQLAGGGAVSPEQMVATCQAKLAERPDDPELHKEAAEALFQMGCLEEAIEEYRAALERLPEDLELLCRLGTVYYADDQYLPAVACFSRAAERNPMYAPAHLGLGLMHLLRGSVDAAINKFAWAITLDPQSAEAYNFLGNAYRQKGELERAAEAYLQAIALQPSYAQAQNNLGLTYLELGRPKEAIEQFRRALETFPDYVPALCNLGRAHLALGNTEAARSAWNQALAINPHNPVAQSLLAEVSAGEPAAAAAEEGDGHGR
ncbi:MAG: tetratricopeptide repeat protein [Bacillota bacterium]|nr:tetratricopeptide repeat protein [Bacillota bacterium]